MTVILRCFSEFGYLPGVLRKSSRFLSHLLMSSCWSPGRIMLYMFFLLLIAVLRIDAAYCYRRSHMVCRSVCQCVTVVSRTKTAEPIDIPFGRRLRWAQGTIWVQISMPRSNVEGEKGAVHSQDMPRHVRLSIYSKRLSRGRCRLGCTRSGCRLMQPGEYDWAVRVRRRYGLMSNYFDHLLFIGSTMCIRLREWRIYLVSQYNICICKSYSV